MYRRARISEQPVHPILAAFPIVWCASTVGALIAHVATGDPFWFRAALTANVAAVVAALVAAIPGAIDLFAGVPPTTRARSTRLLHTSFHLAALGLLGVSAVVLWNRWFARDAVALEGTAPLAFAIAGLVAAAIGGGLGWHLQTFLGVASTRGPRIRTPSHARQLH